MFFSACYRPQNQVLAEMIFTSIALLRSVVLILGKIFSADFFSAACALFSTSLYLGELSYKESLVVISPQASNHQAERANFLLCNTGSCFFFCKMVLQMFETLNLWTSPTVVFGRVEELSGKPGFLRVAMYEMGLPVAV